MWSSREKDGGVSPLLTPGRLGPEVTQDTPECGKSGVVSTTDTESLTSDRVAYYVNQLPSEILLHVFSFLTVVEVCRSVAPVCWAWRELAVDPILWRRLFLLQLPVKEEWVQELVAKAPRLLHLELQGLDDSEDLLIQLGTNCPVLRHLTLRFCVGVTEEAVEVLTKGCPDLQYLNLEGSQITSERCYHLLIELTKLTYLNLSHCCNLDDHGLMEIASHCHHLQHLNIDGVTGIHDYSVACLAQLMSGRLQHLMLDGENLTDTTYQALGACRQLESLGVSFCEDLTDAGLTGLRSLTRLTWLKLRKGTQLRPVGLRALFQGGGLKHLTYLNLGECTLLDDSVLAAIADCCPALLHLELNWCWEVTDNGISLAVAGCQQLHTLKLIGVVELTPNILPDLTAALPNLRVLDLEQCNDMDDTLLQNLVAEWPSLTIFDYWGHTVVAPYSEALSVGIPAINAIPKVIKISNREPDPSL